MNTIWAFQDSGKAFETLEAGKFKKLLWKVGKWIHPDTGQKIDATKEWLKELYENTKAYMKNGGWQAPFSDDHSYSSKATLGWWDDFQLNDDGSISGVVDVKDPLIQEKLRNEQIKFVSPAVKFNAKDNQNNQYNKVIIHVAATAYPVMGNQESFKELSRDPYTLKCSIDGKEETIHYFIGDKDMTFLERLAKELNLEGKDVNEDVVFQTMKDLKFAGEEKKPDESEEEEPKEDEAPKEKSESEKELEIRLGRLEERHNRLLEKEASSQIAMATKAGLPPAIGKLVQDLLLSQGEEILTLSRNDKQEVVTKKINASLVGRDLLKELMANKEAMVDMSVLSREGQTSHNEDKKLDLEQKREAELNNAAHTKSEGNEVIWHDEKRPELGFDVKSGNFVQKDNPA